MLSLFSQRMFWPVIVGKALTMLHLLRSSVPVHCGSEPACAIPGPWNWSSLMEFSYHSFFFYLHVLFLAVTCQNVFYEKKGLLNPPVAFLQVHLWSSFYWALGKDLNVVTHWSYFRLKLHQKVPVVSFFLFCGTSANLKKIKWCGAALCLHQNVRRKCALFQ